MRKLITIPVAALLLASCAKPIVIPAELLMAESECMAQVAKVEISNNVAQFKQQTPQFKDERNAVLIIAIQALADSNKPTNLSPFMACTRTVQNYLAENGAVARSNNEISRKAIGIAGWVGGALVVGNAVEGVVGAIAGSGASTITNSRVVTDSDNYGSGAISASGTGLGTANTVGANDVVGGILPRSVDGANSGQTSNSGDVAFPGGVPGLGAGGECSVESRAAGRC